MGTGVRNTPRVVRKVPLLPPGQLDPKGRICPPRGERADVLFSDGAWRPARVLGWQHRGLYWLIHLEWADGSSEWREYVPRSVRPA